MPMNYKDDWSLFIEIAVRMGASKSCFGQRVDGVWLNKINITYDRLEGRAYYSVFNDKYKRIIGPKWLDNDILVWIDVLKGDYYDSS